jgi:hypothetical protein
MIDELKIKRIQAKLKSFISELEKEENIKIDFNNIRYNSAYYTTSMKVTTLEKNEKVSNVFESICKNLGFTQNIIGMQFNGTNGVYEIVDIKTKNRKYPIIAKSLSTEVSYKYATDHIKKLIGGDKIINRNKNLEKLIG